MSKFCPKGEIECKRYFGESFCGSEKSELDDKWRITDDKECRFPDRQQPPAPQIVNGIYKVEQSAYDRGRADALRDAVEAIRKLGENNFNAGNVVLTSTMAIAAISALK